MKFFAFIMCVYLLCLSCIQCGDRPDRPEGNVKGEYKISATTNHQEHNQTTDDCTPFCNCKCCGSSAFLLSVFCFEAPKAVFESLKFYYQTSIISNDIHSIWQPPKIS